LGEGEDATGKKGKEGAPHVRIHEQKGREEKENDYLNQGGTPKAFCEKKRRDPRKTEDPRGKKIPLNSPGGGHDQPEKENPYIEGKTSSP